MNSDYVIQMFTEIYLANFSTLCQTLYTSLISLLTNSFLTEYNNKLVEYQYKPVDMKSHG